MERVIDYGWKVCIWPDHVKQKDINDMVNEILNFTSGYGFTGIAVALMGRNHPIGIVLASLLFGALYQGGAELDFEFQTITREIVLMIQGLIILFSGALAYLFMPAVVRIYSSLRKPTGSG